MLPIRPTSGVAPPARPARAAGPRAGFQLPAATAAPEPTAAAEATALDGLLAIQEQSGALAGEQHSVGDRAARRHGEEMLRELAALQRALLGGDAAPALQRLAALAAAPPVATAPALRGVLAAVALRARIELARHGARPGAELSLVAAPQHGYSPPD